MNLARILDRQTVTPGHLTQALREEPRRFLVSEGMLRANEYLGFTLHLREESLLIDAGRDLQQIVGRE